MPWTAAVVSIALAAILVLSGCGERADPAPSMADLPAAAEVARNLDADMAQFAQLSGADKVAAELDFGPRLRRDLDVCKGTRYENKPLYLLAQWTLVHGGPEGPDAALRMSERLDRLPSPAYRSSARLLRVKALLRLGRVAEVRPIAIQLNAEIPQFNALGLLEFYETVGNAGPPLPGTSVSGGTVPEGSSVLVAFLGLPDRAAEAWLQPLKQACVSGKVHLVAVTTAGDLLAAATVASAWGVDVRWLRQGDPALERWKLAVIPSSVLLGPGPQRVIIAVDPEPAVLARLGGGH